MKREFNISNNLINSSYDIANNNAVKKSIDEDNILSKFVARYSLIGVINLLIKITIPMSEILWKNVSYMFMAVLIILLFHALSIVIKRKLFEFVIIELIFITIYLLSFIMNNADKSLLFSGAFNTLCICIPIMMCVYAVKDRSILYNNLLKYSYIIIAMSTVSLIVLGSKMNYSMSLSSYLIVYAMIQWNEVFKYKKIKNYVFAIYSFIFILTFGNRGALICLFVFICLKSLHKNKKSINSQLFIIFTAFILFLFLFYFNEILSLLDIMMKKYGIRSYTLTQLVSKEFLTSNSRIELFLYYFNLIKQKPLMGWGVWGGYIAEGLGPHNIIIEFLLAFGVVLGTFFSMLFIAFIIRTMFFLRKTEYIYDLSLIYCSANITMLLSAGNFLKRPDLFIFIGLCFIMNTVKSKKE